MAFRQVLRVTELCDLQWTDIEFRRGTLHVRRLKGAKESTHYLEWDESRPLKALYKASESPYVFISERCRVQEAVNRLSSGRLDGARWGPAAGGSLVVEMHRDGQAIEGAGVAPDNQIDEVRGEDAQLNEALRMLACDPV